jgi:hypothetical protein
LIPWVVTVMGDLYGMVSRTAEGFVSRLTGPRQRCRMAE